MSIQVVWLIFLNACSFCTRQKLLYTGWARGGQDSCDEDSGGPLVRKVGNRHIQVGIVSFGEGCARANKPGVYANVTAAYSWIRSVACDSWKSTGEICKCSSDEIEFDFALKADNQP